jgi:hypothetical protein
MMQLPEGQEMTPSLLFIYFMMGWLIGALLTMVALTFARPFLPMEAGWVKALVALPLVGGVLMGRRVVSKGKQGNLTLGSAIKASIFGG